MKRVLLLSVVFGVMLALVPTGAQAQSAPQCDWFPKEDWMRGDGPKYWCYTPAAGWGIEYSPLDDLRLYQQYGYDAYDGDGYVYFPNGAAPLSQWADSCGFGRSCSDVANGIRT